MNIKLLPEYLKDVGYTTHGFGKWHLGFCSKEYTPLQRGFDTFDGLYIGDDEDYRNDAKIVTEQRKLSKRKKKPLNFNSFNDGVKRSDIYSKFSSLDYASKMKTLLGTKTNLTQPFFIYMSLLTKVYPKEVDLSSSIIEERKTKIQEMDEAVREVVEELKNINKYQNTMIVFMSDNGARYIKSADPKDDPNFPLKGYKNTVHEGGTKVPGFVHSPLIENEMHRC